jgi:hypothetical protein
LFSDVLETNTTTTTTTFHTPYSNTTSEDDDDDDDDDGDYSTIAPAMKNALIGLSVVAAVLSGTVFRRKFCAQRRQRETTSAQANCDAVVAPSIQDTANGTTTTTTISTVSCTCASDSKNTSQFSSGIEYSNNNFLSNYSTDYGSSFGK